MEWWSDKTGTGIVLLLLDLLFWKRYEGQPAIDAVADRDILFGPRVIVFIAGGATYSEIRALSELYKKQVCWRDETERILVAVVFRFSFFVAAFFGSLCHTTDSSPVVPCMLTLSLMPSKMHSTRMPSSSAGCANPFEPL